jgi:hypothetical protein
MTRTPDAAVAVRLPEPDWSRPGEWWRIEKEPYAAADAGGVCMVRERKGGPLCMRPGVAVIGRYLNYPLCAKHLEKQRMWIEDGEVVSWALRP